MLCVSMKTLSHVRAEKKTNRVSNFALLLAIFKHIMTGLKRYMIAWTLVASVQRMAEEDLFEPDLKRIEHLRTVCTQ